MDKNVFLESNENTIMVRASIRGTLGVERLGETATWMMYSFDLGVHYYIFSA